MRKIAAIIACAAAMGCQAPEQQSPKVHVRKDVHIYAVGPVFFRV